MRLGLALVAGATLLGRFASPAGAAENAAASSGLRIGPLAPIRLSPAPIRTVTGDEARIKRALADLATVDRFDLGYAPTINGNAFSPISSRREVGSLLITDGKLDTAKALAVLVAAGPKALPLLLAHLDDKTPTRLVVNHASNGFGGMWFETRLPGNPAYAPEASAMREHAPKQEDPFKHELLDSYRLSVGDLCFVAIGQIVGRSYQAVRYQPTAIVLINSPVYDPSLARSVRELWSRGDPADVLLQSLLRDYATASTVPVASPDSEVPREMASRFQVEAAMRLLYYFPREATSVIAERTRALNVDDQGTNIRAYIRRNAANGVRPADFLGAIAWCREPAIQRVLAEILGRTKDREILTAIAKAQKADVTRY